MKSSGTLLITIVAGVAALAVVEPDAVLHAVTRPRTHRVLEATILPMSDDSMN